MLEKKPKGFNIVAGVVAVIVAAYTTIWGPGFQATSATGADLAQLKGVERSSWGKLVPDDMTVVRSGPYAAVSTGSAAGQSITVYHLTQKRWTPLVKHPWRSYPQTRAFMDAGIPWWPAVMLVRGLCAQVAYTPREEDFCTGLPIPR